MMRQASPAPRRTSRSPGPAVRPKLEVREEFRKLSSRFDDEPSPSFDFNQRIRPQHLTHGQRHYSMAYPSIESLFHHHQQQQYQQHHNQQHQQKKLTYSSEFKTPTTQAPLVIR
ncbi:hypothetical protein TKK_0009723 [Trichogramma kaykai]